MDRRSVEFQAEHHPLVETEWFESDEAYCLHLIHLKAYYEAATLASGKSVLDLGCNNGYGTAILASTAVRTVGLDVSAPAIAAAKLRNHQSRIEFRQVDGSRIPFSDREFDLVTSFQVIEHLTDALAYLVEIRRVLRPDGVLILTTPNAALRLNPGMPPWNEFHIREYRANELHDTLRQCFPNVEVRGLFATAIAYQTEFDRVTRIRQNAAGRCRRVLPPAWRIRAAAIDLVKQCLPEPAIRALTRMAGGGLRARHAVATTGTVARNDGGHFTPRFGLGDFFYKAEDLDRGLDLMALCRHAPATAREGGGASGQGAPS